VAFLPSALKQAWQARRQASTAFLLLWLVLPLAFFSLSNGKLPSYILPCLLPLALLMGNALVDRLNLGQSRLFRINGLLNLVIGLTTLLAMVYLQLTKPVYVDEMHNLVLVFIVLMGWILANLLLVFRPLSAWAAPAIGSWLLMAILPAALPHSVVYNKMPDQFILQHIDELSQSKSLLSNDLGAASAVSWRLQRPEVALYNTIGELKYGLDYPDAAARRVDTEHVQQWMSEARKVGPVGVVMRVKGDDEVRELELLPKDAKRYEQGNMVILIVPQSAL
jgi:4-amino-4-deoxy-L-arabinose transferase